MSLSDDNWHLDPKEPDTANANRRIRFRTAGNGVDDESMRSIVGKSSHHRWWIRDRAEKHDVSVAD